MTDMKQAIKDNVGEAMTNIIVEQIQLFTSICLKFGVPKPTMDRAVSEYIMRTMITGIRMPKTSKTTQALTDLVQPAVAVRHNDDLSSSLPFYNNLLKTSIWKVGDKEIPIFASLQLTDGHYPAVGNPEDAADIATFAIAKNGDTFVFRHLTDNDRLLMDDVGIKHN